MPNSRIKKKITLRANKGQGLVLVIEIGIGMRRAISISKTKKITAKRKNRREKGIRAEFLGSKPHSKGLDFSRSIDEFMAASFAIVNTTAPIIRARIKLKI